MPPPAWSTKLTILHMLRCAKPSVLDSIVYQSGENFLYCVYEWWLISGGTASFQGGGASALPPPNEALPELDQQTIWTAAQLWLLCFDEDIFAHNMIMKVKLKILERVNLSFYALSAEFESCLQHVLELNLIFSTQDVTTVHPKW